MGEVLIKLANSSCLATRTWARIMYRKGQKPVEWVPASYQGDIYKAKNPKRKVEGSG
jgi:hypothetical protein